MKLLNKVIALNYADNLQHNECKEIVEPVFSSCKELWECDEEILRRDANNLMTMMPGSLVTELSGDVTATLVERALSGEEPTLISQ